jgi:hypothetical protein
VSGEPVYYYRRELTITAGVTQSIVYAVRPIPGEKPDPVPVIAGYPENWRPTENAGQCLFALGAPAQLYETFVPRSQFRHYQRIEEAEATRLFPELLRSGR